MQSVEITVVSGENLRNGKKPVKNDVFVMVRADQYSPDQQQYCPTTKMSAVEGGGNATWNEKLSLDLPAAAIGSYITLEVHCRTSSSSSGSRLVGGARVPISDFFEGFVPRNHMKYLSYRLWDPTCERNGVINIAVRVKSPPEPYRCSQAFQPVEAIGVPVGERKRFSAGSIATGVPAVWLGRRQWAY